MLFYALYCDIISLISLKITQAFHLLLGFAENQAIYWDFKIRNSVRITEGSDNRDSDNRGSTVHIVIVKQTKTNFCHDYKTVSLHLCVRCHCSHR